MCEQQLWLFAPSTLLSPSQCFQCLHLQSATVMIPDILSE